jgi:hypothetical protein
MDHGTSLVLQATGEDFNDAIDCQRMPLAPYQPILKLSTSRKSVSCLGGAIQRWTLGGPLGRPDTEGESPTKTQGGHLSNDTCRHSGHSSQLNSEDMQRQLLHLIPVHSPPRPPELAYPCRCRLPRGRQYERKLWICNGTKTETTHTLDHPAPQRSLCSIPPTHTRQDIDFGLLTPLKKAICLNL